MKKIVLLLSALIFTVFSMGQNADINQISGLNQNIFPDAPLAGVITGPATVCRLATGLGYSIAAIPGATNYIWTVPPGAVIQSGQGTNSILVNYPAGSTSGTMSVYEIVGGIPGATSYLAITVLGPTVSGPTLVCKGSTGNTYTTEPGKTAYDWTVSFGGSITGGGDGFNFVTVTWTSVGNRSVKIQYTDGTCTTFATLPVTVLNVQPGIGGPGSLCTMQNGTYQTEPGMTNYIWTAAGGTIVSGQGTNTLVANWNSPGAKTVTCIYTNAAGCTAVTPTSFGLTVLSRPVPTITASTGPTPCISAGNNYSTEAGMSGYAWTVSAGGTITSGSGTNAISVTWNSSGPQTVTVDYTGPTGCNALTPTVYNLNVNPLPVPTITGPASVCGVPAPGNNYTTEPGMTNYVWNLPLGGGTITGGGNGFNFVTVNWTVVGNYTVTVSYTNGNGCNTATPSVKNVAVNALPVPIISGPASVCVNTTGNTYTTLAGQSNYTWAWSPGATKTAGGTINDNYVTITWSGSGLQSVSVNYMDPVSGCFALNSTQYDVTVIPDVGIPVFALGATSIRCQGAATVTYTATATDNTGITYTLDAVSLAAGNSIVAATGAVTYLASWIGPSTITATATGCNGPTSAIHTATTAVLLTGGASVTTPITCFGGTATVTLTATGGTAPYSYTFNGVTNGTGIFTGIPAGVAYAWSITDANLCGPVTGTLNVTSPALLTGGASVTTPIPCFGGTATVTLTAAGGTAPYSYTFNGVTNGTGIFAGIPAGVAYAWSITDANLCGPVTGNLNVIAPALLTGGASVTTPILCFGGTATVTLTAAGGTAPYSYTFNGVTNGTGIFTGIPAGVAYAWSITDANLCGPVTGTLNVTAPALLTGGASVTTPILCFGGTATVTLTAAGGTAPYSYTFNGVTNGTGIFTGIPAGVAYAWSITDANLCGPVTGTLNVTAPALLTGGASVTTPILCFGGTATVTLTAAGGTAPYSYTFNGVTNGTGIFTGIPAGVAYAWSITDANLCGPVTGTLNVTAPALLTGGASVTTPIPCFGGTATVTMTAAGGTAPYSYTFNGVTNGTGIFAGIPAGVAYAWSITDANLCGPVTGTLNVTAPALLTGGASVTTPIPCFGGTATVTLTAAGGTAPYSFTFNGVTNGTGIFAGIPAGVAYAWSITDANLCGPVTGTLNVTAPALLTGGASVTTPILCFGGTATVTLTAAGGTAPYSYTFNGVTNGTGIFAGIPAGVAYAWSITDANLCGPVTGTLNVTAPALLTGGASVTIPILCFGGTATVTMTAAGGTAPYSYTFNGVTNGTGIFAGIPAGVAYAWSITDANLCGPVTGTLNVTSPALLTGGASVTTPIPCFGGTATVTLTAAGGTAPYSYTFNGVTNGTGIFAGIPAGVAYAWSITDANLCGPATGTLNVTSPALLTGGASVTTPIPCFGGTATVTLTAAGGTAPYSYTFNGVTNGTGIFAGIPAGVAYAWSINDANLCGPVTGTLDVTAPTLLTGGASVTTPILCFGETATVTLTAAGGTAPYSYTFNGVTNGTGIFIGIPAGLAYAWSITDVNLCGPVTGTLDVTAPTLLTGGASVTTPILCFGGTATVTLTAAGGTAPYSYTFNGVTNGTGIFAGIPAGVAYAWSITDANLCGPVTGTLNVTAPALLAGGASVTSPILCFGGTATVTLTAIGGTAPYSYTFNGVTNGTGIFAGIPAGLAYAWSINDANLCGPVTGTLDVTEPTALSVGASSNSPVCVGTTLALFGTASGGVGPYTYNWTGPNGFIVNNVQNPTIPFVTLAAAGVYTVTAVDFNGCTAISTTNVTINPAPVPSLIGPASACFGTIKTYTTDAGAGISNYAWVITGGTVSGGGTNTDAFVTVTWDLGVAPYLGSVSVNYANALGCVAPTPTVLNVSINPLPVPTISGPTTLCVNSTATYTTENGQSNYVWSVSPGGFVTGGGTINDNFVNVTWTGSGSQSVSVNYMNIFTCMAVTPTTYPVTIIPNVGIPAFVLGPNSTRCQGAGTVTYTALATDNTTLTYSLDLTSLAAGNTIDAVTGTVTYVAGWVGISYITATATGCGPPTQATHAATTYPTPTVDPVINVAYCHGATTVAVIFSGPVPGTLFDWTNSDPSIGLGVSGSGGIPSFTATNPGNAPVVATITVTPTANGCPGPPMIFTITVNPIPNALATPASQTICSANPITDIVLTGNVAGTLFSWTRDNNATVTGIAASGTGDISGTLTNTTFAPVTVTFTITPSANGCTGTPITATVLVNPTPNAAAAPSSQTICSANPITTIVITGNVAGTIFTWTRDNVATVTGIAANGTGDISGTLTNTTFAPVTVTFTITPSANGCTGIPIIATVLVNPTPDATATPATQTICSANPITNIVLAGNVAGTLFSWTRDNNATATGIAASGTGNISGTLTNTTFAPVMVTFTITPSANGCTGAPITATVLVNPTPDAAAAPSSQTICSANPITTIVITGNVAGTIFTWSRDNVATVTGIAANGTGNISGTLTNTTFAPVTVTFTITPSANGCTGVPILATVLVNPTPNAVATPAAQTICSANPITTIVLTGSVTGTTYNWTRDNTVAVTGIAASGTGNISGTLTNITFAPVTVTFTITPSANGCTGTPILATVLVNPTPTVNTVSNVAYCAGNTTAPINFTGPVAGTTYTWTNSNPAIGLVASGTGNIPSFVATNPGATPISGTITVTPSANGCTGPVMTFIITVNPLPVPTITGPATACAPQAGNVYTTEAGMTGYTWAVSAGGIIIGPTNTNTITVTWNTVGAQTVSVNYTNTYGCTAPTPTVYNVIVNPRPIPVISGPSIVCAGSTGNVYSTLAGMTGYTWTVSAGGTIVGPTNTETITVTWNTAGAQSVTLNYTNPFGCPATTPTVYPVTVNPLPVPTIAGPTPVCTGSTGNLYTTQTGMTGYIWTVSAGGTIIGPTNTNIINVTWNTAGAQTVSVVYTNANGCTNTTPAVYNVTVNPLPVPTITGYTSMCINVTPLMYQTEAGMTNYTWNVSPGNSIQSGQGTNQVWISWTVAGSQWVSVTYTNAQGCTASPPTQLNVFVDPLPDPAGTITGTAAVCGGTNGVAYSVNPIANSDTYVWLLPAGATIATGSGTNSITVDFGPFASSGDITVYGNNLCGNGASSPPFAVTVTPLPDTAGVITGEAAVCQGVSGVIYTVAAIANATGYEWTLPAGATIVSGDNTNTITVDFDMTAVSGMITVYGTNSCGNGIVGPEFELTVNPIPPTPIVTVIDDIILHSNVPSGNLWYFQGSPAPPPNTGQDYTATQSGEYWCVVTLNGCSSDTSNHIPIVMPGIQPEPASSKFVVYPVPNDGRFTVSITYPTLEKFTIKVYNNLGVMISEVRNVEVNGTTERSIDLRPTPSGIYSVVIENGNKQVIRKIMINR
jgi:hypothetical protein